jgi:hypothetical protein
MKTIEISNQTFGALWQKANEADRTEEDILRRILGLSGAPSAPGFSIRVLPSEHSVEGFYDSRFDVKFPEGFRIFRAYKGQNYTAIASQGKWTLNGFLMPFESVNALNVAIGAKSENAWISWFYDEGGDRKAIDSLRKPATIKRRI